MTVPVHALLKYWSYRLFAPDKMLQNGYYAFRRLLERDSFAHSLMAEFEELFYNNRYEDLARVTARYEQFSRAVLAMVESLEEMNPSEARSLRQYFRKFDFYIRFLLAPPEQFTIPPFVVALNTKHPATLLGNKGYNLAQLQNHGFNVPQGFAFTTTAYFALIEENQLRKPINERLAQLNPTDHALCSQLANEMQELILSARLPERVLNELEIFLLSNQINGVNRDRFAVRSSAQREDGLYSFAGQYESILGVGEREVGHAYLQVLASKYSLKALLYRIHLGFMDEETPLAVVVQKMVNAQISGVIYTHLPYGEDGDQYLLIECVGGLGELLVSGQEIPETYLVHRATLDVQMAKPVPQGERLILVADGIRRETIRHENAAHPMLSPEQIRLLSEMALRIEEGFDGHPQDIEWSLDDQGEVVVLQSRPFAAESGQIDTTPSSPEEQQTQEEVLFEGGDTASRGLVSGPIVHQLSQSVEKDILPGSICIVRETPPSLVRLIGSAVGIIAEKGSIAGHFSTVCREKKIPLLVHAQNASQVLPEGLVITLDAGRAIVFRGNTITPLETTPSLQEQSTLSYRKRISSILRFITPLSLTDPRAESFSPQGCRSMHDIIRYTHERSLSAMFFLGDILSGKSKKTLKIQTDLPIDLYVLDLRSNRAATPPRKDGVPVETFESPALSALWGGLSHPNIDWKSHQYFDWKSFDQVVLAGGIASSQSGDLASYAIIGHGYLNVNMRFGYHFTLVDAVCGEDPRLNYCQIRFAGGGGEFVGRHLRVQFLEAILHHFGFDTTVKGDLIDGRLVDRSEEEIFQLLDILGKLLGATKLLDLVLRKEEQIPKLVSRFLQGEYSFTQ
ncbi:MAG: PEP/pyruvate-binding domain-containing protein [Desulfobulbus sp.]